jgi:hypothetical protein
MEGVPRAAFLVSISCCKYYKYTELDFLLIVLLADMFHHDLDFVESST